MVWGRLLDRQELLRLLAVTAKQERITDTSEYEPPSARLIEALAEEETTGAGGVPRDVEVMTFVAETGGGLRDIPSIADAYMRLRVDTRQVKKDVEQGLAQADTSKIGAKSGAQYSTEFVRTSAPRLRDAQGNFVNSHADAGRRAGGLFSKGFGSSFNVQVRGKGLAGLTGQLTGVGDAANVASRKTSLFGKVLGGVSLATGILEPVMAGLIVTTGALAAASVAGVAGLGAYGLALKPLVGEVKNYNTVQDQAAAGSKAAQKQLIELRKTLPPAVIEFAGAVRGAKKEYTSWANSLARPVLAPLQAGLRLVHPVLKALTPLVLAAAGAFSTLVGELSRKIEAGGLTRVVNVILPHVRPVILGIAHAIGNLIAGIFGVIRAFLPMSDTIIAAVVRLTARFREWAASLPSHTGFQSLMNMFRSQTPLASALLRNLAIIIANVARAVTGLGTPSNSRALLQILVPLSQIMAKLTANQGLVRAVLYFILLRQTMRQLTPVITGVKTSVDLLTGSFRATRATVGFLTQMTSGFRSAQVAASSFSGTAGTIGGQLRNLTTWIGQTATSLGRSSLAWVRNTAVTLASRSAQLAAGAATRIAAAAQAVLNLSLVRSSLAWIRNTAVTLASRVAQLAAAAATRIVTAAQIVMNAVMRLNPWILLATAIVVAAVLIVKNWGPISRFFINIWNHIYSGFIRPLIAFFTNTVPHAFAVTLNWLKRNWPLLLGIITGPFGAAVGLIIRFHGQIFNAIRAAWARITGAIRTAVGAVQRFVSGGWGAIQRATASIWNAITRFVAGVWNNIRRAIATGISFAQRTVAAGWEAVRRTTVSAWNNVLRFLAGIWTSIRRTVAAAVDFVKRTVAAGWEAIRRTTANIWNNILRFLTGLWNNIRRTVGAAVDWVKRTIAAGWEWVRRTTANVWNNILRFLGSLWAGIRRVVGTSVEWVKRTLAAGWAWVQRTTANIWGAISRTIAQAWATIKDGVGKGADWVKKRVSDAWNWIVGKSKQLWDAIGRTIGNGIDAGKRGLVTALNVVGGLLNKLIEGYNQVNNIWSFLPGNAGADITFRFRFARGGQVPGYAPGRDTVPAMLSPGEFVMNPVASRAIGYDNLHAMNSMHPVHAATGGQIVSSATKWGGHRYVWGGGANPQTGWDCSSFVNYILGGLGVALPGGFHAPSSQHGPPTGSWLGARPRVAWPGLPGDIYVNSHHMGIVTGRGTGFAARSTATGTGPQSVAPGAYTIERVSNGVVGPFSLPGGAGAISPAQQKLYNAYLATLDSFKQLYGTAVFKAASDLGQIQLIKGARGRALLHAQQDAAQSKAAHAKAGQYTSAVGAVSSKIKPAVQKRFADAQAAAAASMFSGPTGGNPPGGGTGTNTQNGIQLYKYLLANLFGGNKIAAAGATASIWGESAWNPFAQGTGGRGLIGWTPPGTISEAAFRGGMRTQLPEIINFVHKNGDLPAIRQMLGARSVLEAANIWGVKVERFGINDVHPAGVNAATAFMRLAKGGRVRGFSTGGVLPEDVFGIGPSGSRYQLESGERVVNNDGNDTLVRELRLLRMALDAVPGRTAAGVAQALAAPRGTQAQAARLGAR